MKKIILFSILGILVLSGLEAVAVTEEKYTNAQSIEHVFEFLPPEIKDVDNYIKLDIEESDRFLRVTGKPEIPMFVYSFDLPFAVQNIKINSYPSEKNEMTLNKKIQPSPEAIPTSAEYQKESVELIEDIDTYSSSDIYPQNWYDYKITCGLNNDKKRVTHISLYVYPVRYLPALNKLYYIDEIKFDVNYQDPVYTMNFEEEYDMVVIAPAKFSNGLQDFIQHKNDNNMATFLKTTDEIYDEYSGNDNPEKIKYFIKDAIETNNIYYVLLVGGLKSYYNADDRDDPNQGTEDWHLPVRYTNIQKTGTSDPGTISDLYYADIYENGGEFSSWDSNDDGIYANWGKFLELGNDVLDLHPDVYIGRLPVRNRIELSIVTRKIINYESTTPSSKPWFTTMIGIAGLSHDMYDEQPDGEYLCDIAFDYMDDIIDEEVRVYASNNDTGGLVPNRRDIIRAFLGGAGFVLFEGHGHPLRWDTHPVESTEVWFGGIHLRNLGALFNFKKLPFTVVGGCHNGQFNVTWYKTKNSLEYDDLYWTHGDPGCECFSWRLLTIPYGGAIASYGATGLTVSWVGQPVSLNSEMEMNFFYKMGIDGVNSPGEAITGGILKFIDENLVQLTEAHCIAIVHLFGDPSLQLGGYE